MNDIPKYYKDYCENCRVPDQKSINEILCKNCEQILKCTPSNFEPKIDFEQIMEKYYNPSPKRELIKTYRFLRKRFDKIAARTICKKWPKSDIQVFCETNK